MQHGIRRRTEQKLQTSLAVCADDDQLAAVILGEPVNFVRRRAVQNVQAIGRQAEFCTQGGEFLFQFLAQLCFEITKTAECGALRNNADVNVIHWLLYVNNVQFSVLTGNEQGLLQYQF